MTPKNQSILLGGAVVALLSTSFLGVVNCLCCAGVIGGAMVAVWHYTNSNNLTIPAGEGAVMGLSAAALGAVVAVILNIILTFVGLAPDPEFFQDMYLGFLEGRVPADQLDQIEQQMEAASDTSIGAQLIAGVCQIIVWIIFGAIGGAIGAAVFKKGSDAGLPPQAPPPAAPPPPPVA